MAKDKWPRQHWSRESDSRRIQHCDAWPKRAGEKILEGRCSNVNHGYSLWENFSVIDSFFLNFFFTCTCYFSDFVVVVVDLG